MKTRAGVFAAAGFLKVHGVEGLDSIEVNAEIRADGVGQEKMNKFIEDHVKLTLENRGGRAVLTSAVRENILSFSRDAIIDLTVRIPKKLDLRVDDGSGSIELKGITGDVAIDDGSGSLTVVDVGGSLTIDDGSGDIDIDGVGKDLILKETGSGGLHFRNVKGQVTK